MVSFFKNRLYVTILFFLILGIDIYVKVFLDPLPTRYFTKSILIIILMSYFLLNQKETHCNNKYFVFGLLFFWVGDLLLLLYEDNFYYITGLIFFALGKLFYAKRFSHQNDFKISSLLPFLLVVFIYMVVIMMFVYDNLGDFFLPTIVYLFIVTCMMLFVYLRKDSVDKISYYLLMLAVFCSAISDTVGVLQTFYNPDIPYHEVMVMLFYGLFQYFVVFGLVLEKVNCKEDY